MKRLSIILVGLVFGALLVALLGGWLAVLLNRNLPSGRLASFLPWPVACSARGCLTTHDWLLQVALMEQFAEVTQQPAPSAETALTTVVRRHLLEHAVLGEPATVADARRYREEILHLKDEALLSEALGVTPEEYDELVVLPFLQQTALQQQKNAESLDELYADVSRERVVAILPFHYRWDKNTGAVVRR